MIIKKERELWSVFLRKVLRKCCVTNTQKVITNWR